MFEGQEIALWLLLVGASATDLLWGKIFNWLTFPFMGLGLVYAFWVGGWPAASHSLLGVGTAFALFFPLFVLHTVAAGDVKLLMALGAWADARMVLRIAMVAIAVGACVGAVNLLYKRGFWGSAQSLAENLREGNPTPESLKMAFAPAFFCAFLVVQIAVRRHWDFL